MSVRIAGVQAMIEVKQTGHPDPLTFDVVIRESGNETRHQVTMSVGSPMAPARRSNASRLLSGSCSIVSPKRRSFRASMSASSRATSQISRRSYPDTSRAVLLQEAGRDRIHCTTPTDGVSASPSKSDRACYRNSSLAEPAQNCDRVVTMWARRWGRK